MHSMFSVKTRACADFINNGQSVIPIRTRTRTRAVHPHMSSSRALGLAFGSRRGSADKLAAARPDCSLTCAGRPLGWRSSQVARPCGSGAPWHRSLGRSTRMWPPLSPSTRGWIKPERRLPSLRVRPNLEPARPAHSTEPKELSLRPNPRQFNSPLGWDYGSSAIRNLLI